jgi:tRNA(His) 5'-end guanylyltransferase
MRNTIGNVETEKSPSTQYNFLQDFNTTHPVRKTPFMNSSISPNKPQAYDSRSLVVTQNDVSNYLNPRISEGGALAARG